MAVTYNIACTFFPEVDNTSRGSLTADRDDVACDEFMAPQYYEIATGQTDVAISLGPLTTAACLVFKCDQAITVKLNGSATALTLVPNDPVVVPNITAMTVSNATGSTGKLEVGAAGT